MIIKLLKRWIFMQCNLKKIQYLLARYFSILVIQNYVAPCIQNCTARHTNTNLQISRANNPTVLRIKNEKFLGYCFYMNTNIYWDFQICISVPLIKEYLGAKAVIFLSKNRQKAIHWQNELLMFFHRSSWKGSCFSVLAYNYSVLVLMIWSDRDILREVTFFFCFEGRLAVSPLWLTMIDLQFISKMLILEIKTEASLQRCSWENMFWNYAANLHENTPAKVRFQ